MHFHAGATNKPQELDDAVLRRLVCYTRLVEIFQDSVLELKSFSRQTNYYLGVLCGLHFSNWIYLGQKNIYTIT